MNEKVCTGSCIKLDGSFRTLKLFAQSLQFVSGANFSKFLFDLWKHIMAIPLKITDFGPKFPFINAGLTGPLGYFPSFLTHQNLEKIKSTPFSFCVSLMLLCGCQGWVTISVFSLTRCSTLYNTWVDNPGRSQPDNLLFFFPHTSQCSPLHPRGINTPSFNLITSK